MFVLAQYLTGVAQSGGRVQPAVEWEQRLRKEDSNHYQSGDVGDNSSLDSANSYKGQLIRYPFVLFALNLLVTMLPVGAAEGPFSFPGSAVPLIRQQIAALPGGLNNPASIYVEKLHFTYDPTRSIFNSWMGGVRRASATIAPDAATMALDERPRLEKQRLVTISGPIALAIVRAIGRRRITVPASFRYREKQGQFQISGYYPYDHQNAVVFSEVFLSAPGSVQTPNPRALDGCAPRISYVVSFPSYMSENVTLRSCGVY